MSTGVSKLVHFVIRLRLILTAFRYCEHPRFCHKQIFYRKVYAWVYREAMADPRLLNLPDRADWRACKQDKASETAAANQFKATFKEFDFNLWQQVSYVMHYECLAAQRSSQVGKRAGCKRNWAQPSARTAKIRAQFSAQTTKKSGTV